MINENKKQDLEKQIEEAKFTQNMLKDIFRELVTKHPNETERQHLIRAVILLFEKKDKGGMKKFRRMMEKTREMQANKFAADKKEDMRHLLKFPKELWNRFQLLIEEPPFLTEQTEVDWTVKNFPEFVIPQDY